MKKILKVTRIFIFAILISILLLFISLQYSKTFMLSIQNNLVELDFELEEVLNILYSGEYILVDPKKYSLYEEKIRGKPFDILYGDIAFWVELSPSFSFISDNLGENRGELVLSFKNEPLLVSNIIKELEKDYRVACLGEIKILVRKEKSHVDSNVFVLPNSSYLLFSRSNQADIIRNMTGSCP